MSRERMPNGRAAPGPRDVIAARARARQFRLQRRAQKVAELEAARKLRTRVLREPDDIAWPDSERNVGLAAGRYFLFDGADGLQRAALIPKPRECIESP